MYFCHYNTGLLALVWLFGKTAYGIEPRQATPSPRPGSPGLPTVPDLYNVIPGIDWNRTYFPQEPQQIHMSITSDAEYARVQFATLSPIDIAELQYWKTNDSFTNQLRINETVVLEQGQRSIYLYTLKTRSLDPDSVYRYRVGSFAANGSNFFWSSIYEFHTPSKEPEFSFLAIADVASRGVNEAVSFHHVLRAAKSHKYDFITISGDQRKLQKKIRLQYKNVQDNDIFCELEGYDITDFDGVKGDEYLNMFQEVFARLPYIGSPGNHEALFNMTAYKKRFDVVPYEESGSENPVHFSLNYKMLHLVSLSTEVYFEGSPEQVTTALNWLDADLTQANLVRAQRPWIVLISHRPIYCSGASAYCTSSGSLLPSLEALLLRHKVDLYITGHVHDYERTYPVANGAPTGTLYHNVEGFVQVIVGDAGQPEEPVGFNQSIPQPKWSAARFEGYGFSTVRVTPNKLEFKHIETYVNGSLGGVVDSFVLSKDEYAVS